MPFGMDGQTVSGVDYVPDCPFVGWSGVWDFQPTEGNAHNYCL